MDAIITALGFNVKVFLAELVLFIGLLLAMNALFWKPVMAHLAARDKEMADAHHKVQVTEREMEALRADYMARITQIEAEARTHIQSAIKEAQAERERILAEARTHSETILREGILEMEREKLDALQALQARMVGIAVTAADRALGSAGDAAAIRQSIATHIAQHTPTV